MNILQAVFLVALGAAGASTAAEVAKAGEQVSRPLRKELVSLAHQVASEMGDYNLDYSHRSVQDVEEILADFHKLYASTGQTEGMNGIAMEFAAYLVATIERNGGDGRWEVNHPEFGDGSFPFYWRESTLFPLAWCQKRIFDGEADNVWSKYQALVLATSSSK